MVEVGRPVGCTADRASRSTVRWWLKGKGRIMTAQKHEDAAHTGESETTEPLTDSAEGDPREADQQSIAAHDHDDALADEWGDESFPSSDPPAHY